MRVDRLDETLIFESQDKELFLSCFQEPRKLPEYIEKEILKLVFDSLKLDINGNDDVTLLIKRLPTPFINKVIFDVESMFSDEMSLYSDGVHESAALYLGRHLSYLMYYLPVNVFKVWKPLVDLQVKDKLKWKMRILDIGTGPGSVAVGIMEYYRMMAEAFPYLNFVLSFVLLDGQREFLTIAKRLINSLTAYMPPNLFVSIEESICRTLDSPEDISVSGEFDLITMSNFLTINEMRNSQNAVAIVSALKDSLKKDGSVIIIENGIKNNCLSFKTIRNDLVNQGVYNVYSPCNGIWQPKKEYSCTCFNMVRCFWEIPLIYKFLRDHGLKKGGRYDVPFNYAILRKDGKTKYRAEGNNRFYVQLKDLREYIDRTVNVKAIIRTVIDRGDKISVSLCDGSMDLGIDDDSSAVWIEPVDKEWLVKKGLNLPIVAAEKITLKKVKVIAHGTFVVIPRLRMQGSTEIEIEY
ncbi:MAG: class I SAM-dependent methyltransferase [Clostridiales bacterium]|jgi:hypothetical protein|nr:class I SAM-dependent methyltransferase [Clostridiales bacterium]